MGRRVALEAVTAEAQVSKSNHYMPATVLDSQLATFETLQPDEPGQALDSGLPPDRLVLQAVSYLNPR